MMIAVRWVFMNAVVFTEVLKLGMGVTVNPLAFLSRLFRLARTRGVFGVGGGLMNKGR